VEGIHRRMALIQMVVGAIIFPIILVFNEVKLQDGVYWVYSEGHGVLAANFARDLLFNLFQTAAGIWFFIGFFSIAKLLISYRETGIQEMLFTKGIPRWQVFTGRIIGANLVFGITLALLTVPPAVYVRLRFGYDSHLYYYAIGILWLSFFCLTMLMAAVSIFRATSTIVVAIGFMEVFLAGALASRKVFYEFIHYAWFRHTCDALYYILPRPGDLIHIAESRYRTGVVESWAPLWTTLAFAAVIYALSVIVLSRKTLN
jgi:ABC-type transport system involved in multi-copper enzyme maturation permease subunit